MNLPPHLSVRGGRLCIGGLDTLDLAQRFGTPLYVTDADRIQARFQEYIRALGTYTQNFRLLFAAKANGNPAILRTLALLGAGADVFSAGEITLSLGAGMKAGDLLFNGSSKTPGDLALAIGKEIPISVDSVDELMQIDLIARETGKTAKIAFRVNPALDIPTHPKIATGLATSKFGIPHEQIPAVYKEALGCRNVAPIGIHCHIGSQILDIAPFARAAEVMMQIAAEITRIGVKLEFIDLGGGLGIPYRHGTDPSPSPADYARAVMPVFLAGCREVGISPSLWVEPGRSVVGDSTILLTRVNSVKKAYKTFVNVDAGFNLLVRPVMYDAYHEVVVAGRMESAATDRVTVTGPICESGDILASDRLLPPIAAGDILAVLDAGAYGYAMSSQYNSRPRCAEVLLKGGQAALMRRAETVNDLLGATLTPPWLEDKTG